MVEINYVENPDSCFMCENFKDGKCTRHNLTLGKLYAMVMKKNPYRLAELLVNVICNDGFIRKKLEKKPKL